MIWALAPEHRGRHHSHVKVHKNSPGQINRTVNLTNLLSFSSLHLGRLRLLHDFFQDSVGESQKNGHIIICPQVQWIARKGFKNHQFTDPVIQVDCAQGLQNGFTNVHILQRLLPSSAYKTIWDIPLGSFAQFLRLHISWFVGGRLVHICSHQLFHVPSDKTWMISSAIPMVSFHPNISKHRHIQIVS